MPRKTGRILVADFTKRSRQGIEFAKKTLKAEAIQDARIREALDYYLSNWGNFSQPGLFSAACEAVGGDPESIVPAQAALAMIVAAFDIHDDIIDKSVKKHDKATIYGKFGPEITILLGNAFMVEGMKLFADSAALLPKQNGKRALEILKSRLFEVGNAHGLELSYRESKSTSLEGYLRIIEMKSASIEADVELGALFGGAKNTVGMARLGRIIGKLIMLREEFVDLFDVEELTQRLSVGDLPLPIVAAMQQKEEAKDILRILCNPAKTAADTETLLNKTLTSTSVKKLRDNMQLLIDEGTALLRQLPPTKLQETLQNLLKFMLEDLEF
jgi:geranylgeranyl pyrophosphate synthase